MRTIDEERNCSAEYHKAERKPRPYIQAGLKVLKYLIYRHLFRVMVLHPDLWLAMPALLCLSEQLMIPTWFLAAGYASNLSKTFD